MALSGDDKTFIDGMEKTRAQGLQDLLWHLLHVDSCLHMQKRDKCLSKGQRASLANSCEYDDCSRYCQLFQHFRSCNEANSCSYDLCSDAQAIWTHWSKCPFPEMCQICKGPYEQIVHVNAPTRRRSFDKPMDLNATVDDKNAIAHIPIPNTPDGSQPWHDEVSVAERQELMLKHLRFRVFHGSQFRDPRCRHAMRTIAEHEKDTFENAKNAEEYYALMNAMSGSASLDQVGCLINK